MGICTDKSLSYLAARGYNVVRHPGAQYQPLTLLGRQSGETTVLGPLKDLILEPAPLPHIERDMPAAELSGKTSSYLSLGLGIGVLSELLESLGGKLAAKLDLKSARKVRFTYPQVFNDGVDPTAVGRFLAAGEVDFRNVLLREYVLGNGELFVITKIAKADSFSVTFADSRGAKVAVEVPPISQTVEGSVKVSTSDDSSWIVSFSGSAKLTFGFQCFRVGVLDGVVSLTSVKAGTVMAAVETAEEPPVLLNSSGLLTIV